MTLSAGDRNDGERDEKDHITSTEGVIGGSGNDEIMGYGALNILYGTRSGTATRTTAARAWTRSRTGRSRARHAYTSR